MSKSQITPLQNGLRIVTDKMDSIETITIGLWVGIGTRSKPEEINGIAHFLEHMIFKGTPTRTALDIVSQVESVGGMMNAHTSREYTAYYLKILKDDLPLAVDILSDILQNSTFEEAELSRERGVILQEIGQSLDTPDDIIFDYFRHQAFPNQAMGRPILGTAETVGKISQTDLKTYIKTHYTAPRIVLAAAGNIDHETLVSLAQDKFAELGSHAPDLPLESCYQGGDFRKHQTLEQVHLILGLKGAGYYDQGYYPQMILSTLFGGGMSSRLFQEIREKRGLVYHISSFLNPYKDIGTFRIYAGTGPEQIKELVPVVQDEFAKLPDTLREEEIERAKIQLKASLLMSLEKSMVRCEQLGHHVLLYGRVKSPQEIIDDLMKVSKADLETAHHSLIQAPLTLAALGPIDHLLPYDQIKMT